MTQYENVYCCVKGELNRLDGAKCGWQCRDSAGGVRIGAAIWRASCQVKYICIYIGMYKIRSPIFFVFLPWKGESIHPLSEPGLIRDCFEQTTMVEVMLCQFLGLGLKRLAASTSSFLEWLLGEKPATMNEVWPPWECHAVRKSS